MWSKAPLVGVGTLLWAVYPLLGQSTLSTGFDVVNWVPGDDTFAESVWDAGGGLPGFSKAKAGYSIRTLAVDAPAIVYDWAIPGHPLKGQLQPGSILFLTWGLQSAVQWTTETCNLSPNIKSAPAKFWYINSTGFPIDQGPAEYHEPQQGSTICQPTPNQPVESLKTLLNVLDDDGEPAMELVEFDSSVELLDSGEYEYSYSVVNKSIDELTFDWSGTGLTGTLAPNSSTSIRSVSLLPPMELLLSAAAELGPVTGAPRVSTADTDPPSAAGLAMGGYSMVYVPVPEPASLLLCTLGIAFMRRR